MLPKSPPKPDQPEPTLLPSPKHPPPQRDKHGLTNALLRWELLRAVRKIRFIVLSQIALIGVLILAIWALWATQYPSENISAGDAVSFQKALFEFQRSYLLTFFLIQQVMVLIITPITVASAFFEARKTYTDEALRLTDLTQSEIYHGKLWARVLQMMLIVFVAVPFLMLPIIWGGLPVVSVVICYLTTLCTICTSAAITAAVTRDTKNVRGCVVMTYFYVCIIDCLIFPASPFLMIVTVLQDQTGLVFCPGLFFLIVQPLVFFFGSRYAMYDYPEPVDEPDEPDTHEAPTNAEPEKA